MGNHRADRRGPSRRPSVTPIEIPAEPMRTEAPAPVSRRAARSGKAATNGRRRAARHTSSRGPLFRGLPSAPVLVGLAALAVSAGGAVTVADPSLVGATQSHVSQASALSGASDVGQVSLLDARDAAVSRDSRRDALADAAGQELVAEAEAQAKQRNAALAKFAQQAEAQAAKIALNQWVLPVDSYQLTARFGEYGLWSSYHTGLDFAAPSGTPIHAVAGGVVTSIGYDGSYGNKTVITLDDGTELWFCHQTTYAVSEGQEVRAGDIIGTIGSTGNVTGPHLHLEVRPGGGDPVDPFEALVVHGLNP